MDVGGEIRLGSMLFTLVEPHQGHEVAYNRWYERDHFYAGCMVGPWLFAGRRWVATRDLKYLRFPLDPPMFGDARRGSYLAVYWVLEGKHDDHFAWALRQVRWLHEQGRMFAERDHVHTLLHHYRWAFDVDSDGVPAELALDHPYQGMVVTMVERGDGVDHEDLRDRWLADISPAGLWLGFEPIPLPPGSPVDQPGLDGLDRRTLLLTFVDGAVERYWDRYRHDADDIARRGLGRVAWAAPFIPTIPGTDTYAERLW